MAAGVRWEAEVEKAFCLPLDLGLVDGNSDADVGDENEELG